jgi:hypothetical protein
MGAKCFPCVDIHNHFSLFGALLKGSNHKRVRHIIWFATIWCIWRKRNNIIFRGDFVNVSSLVDQIIYNVWFWCIGRVGIDANVTFSDWCKNPMDCFL